MNDSVRPTIVVPMTATPNADPASPVSDEPGSERTVDPDPLDLDAIEADLEMVESTLASLAAGTYFASRPAHLD